MIQNIRSNDFKPSFLTPPNSPNERSNTPTFLTPPNSPEKCSNTPTFLTPPNSPENTKKRKIVSSNENCLSENSYFKNIRCVQRFFNKTPTSKKQLFSELYSAKENSLKSEATSPSSKKNQNSEIKNPTSEEDDCTSTQVVSEDNDNKPIQNTHISKKLLYRENSYSENASITYSCETTIDVLELEDSNHEPLVKGEERKSIIAERSRQNK